MGSHYSLKIAKVPWEDQNTPHHRINTQELHNKSYLLFLDRDSNNSARNYSVFSQMNTQNLLQKEGREHADSCHTKKT